MSPITTTPAPMDEHAQPGGRAVTRLGRWLAAGTGYLAMLTAVGGLLAFLAYAIGGWQITTGSVNVIDQGFSWLRADSWGVTLLQTGNLVLDVLVLAVALYTAYGIAGRPALVPALAGGMTAMSLHTGYLGGLAAGILAGAATRALHKITVPAKWRPFMAKAVIPLTVTLFTAVVFFCALLAPRLGRLNTWLYGWLTHLELTDQHVALGLLLGLMVCCDFGGVFKKIAYAYALAGLGSYLPTPDHLTFMAVVVAAGMVPPLGLSLATLVRRGLFSEAERNYGKVAWLLGLIPVSAAAVPFALRDPLRVIPAAMAGGAVTGMLTITFGSSMAVPFGGIFAADQVGRPLLFAAAVAAGVVVTAGVAVGLKSLRRAPAPVTPDAAVRSRAKVPAVS
ncbi:MULTISPECIES: fructose-specific PTS transporter subunit EIIC [Streptomyces]|uniref:Fructose-specific PTS transporter subunit EIIC n=2 Tax=Streptomyces TaxID=1883 RepID=A0ABV9J9Z5_9ACTN